MTNLIETPHSRRDFLKGGGALIVAFSTPLALGTATAKAATGAIGPALVDPNLIDSWVAIQQSGRVTIFTGKSELGTGLRTSQMQIAADELDVPMNMIDLVMSDTWLTPDQGTTAGSQSIKTNFAGALRRGCAEARQALIDMGAKKLGVPANTLVTKDGAVVSASDSSKRATYAELIGGQQFKIRSTGRAPLKKPSELKVVGRSIAHVDVPDKVRSKLEYIQNVKVPGMLHGRVVRPPGSTRRSSVSTGSRSESPIWSRS